jgi:hypothetical protein
MNGIDDDELRAMLETRATRASIDPVTLLADGHRRALEPVGRRVARGSGIGRVAIGLGGLAAAMAVILLVAVPFAFRPATSPAPGVTQLGSAPPPPAGDRLPGGFPTEIAGEPVFVGVDALGRWRAATDDRSFLVGGWYDSHALRTCSNPVGQAGLDPLEQRGCPGVAVAGLPGDALFRDGLVMPDGAGPIVLRLHTRDAGASACTPEGRAYCLERTIVEGVVWFGDADTVAKPISPPDARWMATTVFVTEWRDVAGQGEVAVSEDTFTVPIACPAPWPPFLFSIHGDPRYGLVAVFPDRAAREDFESHTDPAAGAECLDLPIERPSEGRWVGHENMLALLFADDTFATRLAEVFANPGRPQKAISLTEPEFDRTLGTVTDYIVARAAGEIDHAWGRIGDQDANPYRRWFEDVLRRQAADALVGRLEVLDEQPTEARVGERLWRLLDLPAAAQTSIVRVTYDQAIDPALATEDFLVIHVPDTEYRDWWLVRIAGAPYPG